jgi:hypothetical protein
VSDTPNPSLPCCLAHTPIVDWISPGRVNVSLGLRIDGLGPVAMYVTTWLCLHGADNFSLFGALKLLLFVAWADNNAHGLLKQAHTHTAQTTATENRICTFVKHANESRACC